MGSGKRLSREEIERIKTLKEEGYSNRQIALRLGRSPRVINNLLKDIENYGRKPIPGRPRATTERERSRILRTASNSSMTAREIGTEVGVNASLRTVQRILKRSPVLQRRRLKKKPLLLPRHKEKRLEFARAHMAWKDEWNQVIFSDEKRFCLDGPDGYAYYFHDLRKEERFLTRHHRREGGIMIWGAISVRGPVELKFIEGTQTGVRYRDMLEEVKPLVEEIMEGQPWIFQQDHAAVHTARVVREWFRANNVVELEWPSVSPDLNIIENLWGWLTRRVYRSGQQYGTITELKTAIRTAWDEIPLDLLQKLYSSIENRIYQVILNRGGHTKY